jgi:hypothetical protein
MNPTSRRNFAKGLGLVGILAVGVEGYKKTKERIVYKQDELPTVELEKQLEGKPVLQLAATYGVELPREKVYEYGTNNTYLVGFAPTYKPGTEKHVSVKIVPGPDGKLYVKENDTWRKM